MVPALTGNTNQVWSPLQTVALVHVEARIYVQVRIRIKDQVMSQIAVPAQAQVRGRVGSHVWWRLWEQVREPLP